MSSSSVTRTSSSLPPASPTYILRGHRCAVHTLLFFRNNLRLLSGDSQGWIIIWDLPTRRAVAVWRAHGSELYSKESLSKDALAEESPDSENKDEVNSKGKTKATVVDEEDEEEVEEEIKREIHKKAEAKVEEDGQGEEGEGEESANSNSSHACVLGACIWNHDTIVTQGRDGRISAWQFAPKNEADMSTVLPLDGGEKAFERRAPWLRHILNVPTLNFCAFASCTVPVTSSSSLSSTIAADEEEQEEKDGGRGKGGGREQGDDDDKDALIIATPGINESEIALYHLPSEKRIGLLRVPGELQQQQQQQQQQQSSSSSTPLETSLAGNKTGMVMTLRLFFASASSSSPPQKDKRALVVLAGYENGQTIVFRQVLIQQAKQTSASSSSSLPSAAAAAGGLQSAWQIMYTSRPHTQPVLGLDLIHSPGLRSVKGNYTSSKADMGDTAAVSSPSSPPECTCTFFTSSVDAILAKHKFSLTEIGSPSSSNTKNNSTSPSLGDKSQGNSSRDKSNNNTKLQEPLIARNTRHASQQGLTVRSDGRILATAGWDARVRVYSAKTCKELAVLKWHRQACYAVAFAPIRSEEEIRGEKEEEEEEQRRRRRQEEEEEEKGEEGERAARAMLVRREMAISTLARRRIEETKLTHWLAAGSKDGKISLWSIY